MFERENNILFTNKTRVNHHSQHALFILFTFIISLFHSHLTFVPHKLSFSFTYMPCIVSMQVWFVFTVYLSFVSCIHTAPYFRRVLSIPCSNILKPKDIQENDPIQWHHKHPMISYST